MLNRKKACYLIVPIFSHLPVAFHETSDLGFREVLSEDIDQNLLSVLESKTFEAAKPTEKGAFHHVKTSIKKIYS